MIYGYTIYQMFFIFIFWGVTGWLIEVADMKIEAGEFQNRGFLHMPICPLYGIGMLLLCVFVKNTRVSYELLFVLGVLVGSLVEYFVGWLLERVFNTRWWDYSHMKYQIKGRVCLRNTFLFGVGAIVTMGFVQPGVEEVMHQIPASMGTRAIDFLVIVLVIDTIISVHRALQYKEKYGDKDVFVIFKSHR